MKKNINIVSMCLLLAAVFAILSCQTISSIIQEPKVSVRSVDLDKISFNGIDMICRLNVENPNAFDIPFPEIDWQLFINTNSFISGTLKNDTRLGRNRTVTVDVPFSVTYSGLYNTFTSLWDSKEAAYKIALGVRFPIALLESKTFNLDYSGSIPMLQIPKIEGFSFKTGKINLTGIEQDWTVMIDNPNIFPIPFPQFNWDYGVNNVPVLKGSLDAKGEIAALSKSPVTLKAAIQYVDLIRALGTLGNASELKSLMKMDSRLPIPALEKITQNFEIPAVIPVFHKPELSFRGINIKNMGLQKLDFIVTWEIENRNSFPLNIGTFNYDLAVNNSTWAKGVVNTPPRINPNSITIIPLDISINSLNLITQIIDIINRGASVNFKSTGNFDFIGDMPGLEKMDMPFDLSGVTKLLRL